VSASGRRYSAAEKLRAVGIVLDTGRSAASVARELGIGAGSLRRWIEAYRGEQWAAQVAPHFGFVEDHGFAVTDVTRPVPGNCG
jgi:transposase-like protein